MGLEIKCPKCGLEGVENFKCDKKRGKKGTLVCSGCGKYFSINIETYSLIKESKHNLKEIEKSEKREINQVLKMEASYKNLKDEHNSLKYKYSELLKQKFQEDEFVEVIYEAVNKIKFPLPSFIEKIPNKSYEQLNIANINISDLHYGLVVDPEKNRKINKYNKDIALLRLNDYINKSLNYIDMYGCRALQLNFLGDIGNFSIHPADFDSTTTDTIIDLYSWIISTVNFLSTRFKSMNITFVEGNHEDIRKDHKPNIHNKVKENFGYLIGRLVKKYYEEHKLDFCNIGVDVPETFYTINKIGNSRQLVLHGDVVKGGNSLMGVPSFGLIRLANRMDGLFNIENIINDTSVKFDSCIMGHFHRSFKLVDLLNRPIYVAGCIVGMDEFALNAIQSACLPEQTLLIFDENGIIAEHNIKL